MPSKTQRELAFLLTGRDVSASKAMKGVSREVGKLSGIAGKAGANIGRNVERAALLGAGAAVGAIGFAINAAQDWETAFAGVRKTIDGDVTAIGEGILAMSNKIPVAATELAGIAEAAGALGVAKDDVLEFTEVVALLGVTTDLTTDAAATSLGKLRTTLGLTGSEFRELGDALVFLGNHGASTESEILSMAESIAGAAGIMNASKEDVLGWASAVASTGEEAEAGGSSIQRFWLESFKSVSKGGKELKLMAKISGQTTAAFKKDFGKDATGTLAKFITHLGKLSKAEQLATLELLGFTDIRITRALLKLLGNTDNLTTSLTDAKNATGAMGEEAAKRFETVDSKIQTLKNNVNTAAIVIGSELLPVLAELSQEGTDWIQDHQPEIKAFAADLRDGIRDAVTWAKSLDWAAIGAALQAGAGAAKLMVDAFMAAPPWVQQVLVGGFAANKLTGGAIGDALGFALKTGLQRMMINAAVANINAGVVNGAGLGGAAGAAGKGAAAAAGMGLLGATFALTAVAGIELAIAEALGPPLREFFKLPGPGQANVGGGRQFGPLVVGQSQAAVAHGATPVSGLPPAQIQQIVAPLTALALAEHRAGERSGGKLDLIRNDTTATYQQLEKNRAEIRTLTGRTEHLAAITARTGERTATGLGATALAAQRAGERTVGGLGAVSLAAQRAGERTAGAVERKDLSVKVTGPTVNVAVRASISHRSVEDAVTIGARYSPGRSYMV